MNILRLDIKERFVIEVSNEDSICLPMLLFDVKQGDSISFIVPNTNSIRNILSQEFADLFTAYSEIKLVVKVHSVVNKGTYEQQKKQFDLWSKSQREYEREILKNYVAKSNYPFALTSQGIYKYIIKQGTGVLPQKDDIISINYQGSLLSREIINHFTSLEFAFGSQWQVIDGIERAIKTMREGERAIILVSSDYAWGADGTSDGSIAPFTSVQYDLELVSVTKPTRQKN